MSDKSALIREAQKYLSRGQLDKAVSEWEKIAKEFPDATSFNTIGDLYLRKGDKTNAIESFHKAANLFRHEGFSLKALAIYKKILNIKPSDSDSLFSLGELSEEKGLSTDAIKYYLATADSLSKEGKKDKLLEIYEKILTLSPANIPLRNKVAEIYSKEGLISESIKQYLEIANSYSEKGNIDSAIEYYKKVLNIQPLHKDAILGINYLYEKSGNFDRALEQINEAVSSFPEDVEIHLRCAELYTIAKNFNKAREHLKKVTEAEPANMKAKKLLADLYLHEGDREKALTEYLPVLDEMIMNERYNSAIKLLKSFKDIDPIETGKRLVSLYRQLGEQTNVVSEIISLGDAFLSTEMQKEALECYKEAIDITPDDESLKAKIEEIEKQVSDKYPSVTTEKTIDEAFVESDIFLRYGLYENAKNLLEPFKQSHPDNIDLHEKLKSLYLDLQDKEQAIAECLILNELFQKSGDTAKSDQIITEALSIYPEDPRLASFATVPLPDTSATVEIPQAPSLEDYSEELAEADFYSKQGLLDEARGILEKLQNLFPDNAEISQRFASLGQISEAGEKIEHVEEKQPEPSAAEGELLEAEELQELALDSDVMDIFNEFKKGIEKDLEEEDYETHYNLGIAYKEMGLLDDAIREFQTSRKNPKRFVTSSNMLGVCYMEKGLYSLAVDILKSSIEEMEDRGESYWAMKYDLADAYEKNGNLKEAFDLYTEVYGWNSKFRSISDKIENLKTKVTETDTGHKKPKGKKDRVSYL
jgi:tetratricopeptide (TPR) repeat protein